MPPRWRDLLIDYLPKAGLIFADRHHVLGNDRRDAAISRAFRSAGIIAQGSRTKDDFRRGKSNVEAFLVDLYFNAANEAYKPLIESGETLVFETILRENTWWAEGDRLGNSIFAEFFHALVDARSAWKNNPRPPFDLAEHSALAQEIDKFLAAQENWGLNRAQMAFYEIAGGFADEGGEAEGEDEDSSSFEDSDEDDAPVTRAAQGAGVAAAMAFDDAVRAAVTADDQADIRALVPQLSNMEIDEALDDHNHDDEDAEENEAQEGEIATDNGDNDVVMMD
ncbi:hypothetical protein KJ359_008892 [Pestalotiopsis sp. 9143b]|nr:hypothetical protein KJ359_008892 [Pestalotiopsis sp. 9143b]